MMKLLSVTDIIGKVESITKSPENYLSVQEDVASEIKQLTKKLYDFNKYNESAQNNTQILEELILENLDEEQVWQQIELQNNFICNEFVSDIAQFLVKKNDLSFASNKKVATEEIVGSAGEVEEVSEEEAAGETGESEAEDEKSDNNSEDEISSYSDLDSGGDNEQQLEKGKSSSKRKKASIVDDRFFKLSEMENFLEKEENKMDDNEDNESLIDYFEGYSSESDNEKKPHYDDFFDPPDDPSQKKKKRSDENSGEDDKPLKKKKVKFSLGHPVDNGKDSSSDFEDDDNVDSDESEGERTGNTNGRNIGDAISSFEARQERLRNRIKALEEEALKEKSWQMKGEVTATNRPQNSLLEEYVEFDAAVRPPPVITEKSTLKLEDIIKQRIKDKAWDDVERKIKPVEDPKEYKKRLVLDQEKSKLSLAQIYEQEYLKQKEAVQQNVEDKPDAVPSEHLEIDKMMKTLFTKLDALSNFHFTPKMVTAEVKIVSNLPAITVEEVAPVATSDAALLAPEEIKPRLKGDLIGKTERTKTDKKRERRMKKKKQKIRQQEIEKKEKLKVKKMNDFSKKSKKISKKLAKKLGGNVTQLNEDGNGKYIRSSNAFFSKLQDDVKSHVKAKSVDLKKCDKDKKLDIKKLKL